MSDDEFAKWVAIGTIDDWSGEWHTAIICKTITNALLDLQRRGGVVFAAPEDNSYKSELDFLMTFPGEKKSSTKKKKPLTADQQARLFQRMAGL